MIVLGKHTEKIRNKKTQTIKLITQGGDFLTTHTTNIEILLATLDARKSATWKFHVDDSQKYARYDMIIGRYLLSELQIDLQFSHFMIREN